MHHWGLASVLTFPKEKQTNPRVSFLMFVNLISKLFLLKKPKMIFQVGKSYQQVHKEKNAIFDTAHNLKLPINDQHSYYYFEAFQSSPGAEDELLNWLQAKGIVTSTKGNTEKVIIKM